MSSTGAEPLAGRDLPARSLGFDLGFAAVLVIVTAPILWHHPLHVGLRLLAESAAVAGFGVAIALRRRFPVAAAALAFAVGLCQLGVGLWVIAPGDALLLVVLYSVTAFGPTWAGPVALGATLLGSAIACTGLFVTGQSTDSTRLAVAALAMAALALASWALGRARRGLAASQAFQRRAEKLTETDRERVEQLATAAERARIAREMHDIVAHSLSIVIAQADGGRYSGAKDPAAAITALETISQTGRAALADMRRILGVLRPEDDGADLAPQPDAQSIGALVSSVRAAGLAVSFVSLGVERTLPPGMGLALYRICQEALTNAMKHAGPDARVTVVCHWLPSQVSLDVQDDGRGAAASSDGAGQGLTGMRQRAEMFGGTLAAGPRPGGGFRVHVTLPTPPATGAQLAAAAARLAPGEPDQPKEPAT